MKKPTKNCVVFKCTKLIRIWPEQKTNQVCRKKVFPRTLKRAPLATKAKITFQISKTPISFIGINGIGCRYVYNHNPNSRTCVQKIIKHIHSSPIHIHIAVLVLTSHLTYWNFAPEKPNIHHWVAVLQKKPITLLFIHWSGCFWSEQYNRSNTITFVMFPKKTFSKTNPIEKSTKKLKLTMQHCHISPFLLLLLFSTAGLLVVKLSTSMFAFSFPTSHNIPLSQSKHNSWKIQNAKR